MNNLLLIVCVAAACLAIQVSARAASEDHQKMIQAVREALARERCDRCCTVVDGKAVHRDADCACANSDHCAKVTPPDTKEGKLSALLREYRGGKVSPTDYHAQRAKILAGN